MDFAWVASLDLEPTKSWTNVTSFGKTKLKAAEQAMLVKLLHPGTPYKFTQRSHWFKLANKKQNSDQNGLHTCEQDLTPMDG